MNHSDIKSAFVSLLTGISKDAGYSTDLSGVGKKYINPEDSPVVQDAPYLIFLTPDDNIQHLVGYKARVNMSFLLAGYLKISDETVDEDTKKDKLVTDILKCLESDITLGGECIQMKVKRISRCDGFESPYYYIAMRGEIIYHYDGRLL